MNSVEFSLPARRDLREILAYIARDSRRNGERFLERMEAKCRQLPGAPDLGHLLSSFPEVRYWTFRRYVIIYPRASTGIEVLRVLHAARDWMATLEEQPE
jgi:toxin ParE1/3/4